VSISVILAGKEHLAALGTIETAAATLFSETDLPADIRYRVTGADVLHDAQDNARIWVALADGDVPVGFAMATLVDNEAHLDELNVLPDYGRRGIGTELVNAVTCWARDNRFSVLTLITFKHLPWNAAFYEKLGFERVTVAELGRELAGLIAAEGKAGIDVKNRIAMRLELDSTVTGS
jgi:GNAT superfamily N-acetyltransferase